MATIESMQSIAEHWKAEGKSFRPSDVQREWNRQAALFVRWCEDDILVREPDSEVGQQIQEHRAAGNWTTQRREPVPDVPHL